MMTIAPTSALPSLAAPTPQGDTAAPDATAPGRSFAHLLEQRRGPSVPRAHEAPRSEPQNAQGAHGSQAATSSAAARSEHGHQADSTAPRGQRPAGPGREAGKSRDAGSRAASARADAKADSDRKAAATADSKTAAAADQATAVDPALAAWLAGLQLPDASAAALPTPPTTPVTTAAVATPVDAAASAVGVPGSDGDSGTTLAAIAGSGKAACASTDTTKAGTVAAAAAELAHAGMPGGHDTHHAAGDAPGDDSSADAQRGDAGQAVATAASETPKATADKLAASFSLPAAVTAAQPTTVIAAAEAAQAAQAAQAAASAQAVAATTPGRDASRPLPVALATPVTAPEFPQAIGVRIGLLARDGIEHAELQLNPAEMGPVSVRIVVDGAQARVDFGADVAATRQAIESSLPELAGALRDAGFTLTGGGVSQHAHPQRDDQAGTPGQARGGARGEPGQPGDAPATAARRTVRAGGVDLYA